VKEIKLEPNVGRTHDAKTRSETKEKNNMVKGIKGSTKASPLSAA